MSQSSVITALQRELVNPRELRKEKNIYHLAAIRPQPLLMVSPEEGNSGSENTGNWPHTAEVPIRGMISVSLDSCIFSYLEKH